MSKFSGIFISLIILTFSLCISAQKKSHKFEHLTTRDGLSQSSITCIMQDSKGFIWFGTQDGLNKYDGFNFSVFRYEPTNNLTISGNSITTIIEDHNGNLWIGSEGGLDLFKKSKNEFIHYKHDDKNGNSVSNNNINSIVEDHNGNLWIGTNGGGLNMFDIQKGTFTHYYHEEQVKSSLSSDNVYIVFEDSKNNLWVGSWHGDLDLLNSDKQKFQHIYYSTEASSSNIIRDIMEDSTGDLWICTIGSGLFKMVLNSDGKYSVEHYTHDIKNPNSLSGDAVYAILEDMNRQFWIGTENEGLNIFSKENNRFIHYKTDAFNENSISHNSIWSLFEDKTGNIWIGTFAGGINMVPRYGGNFNHYKYQAGDKKSLSNNAVTCFYEDTGGKFWIGTDGGGLNLFRRNKGTFQHFNSSNSNLNSDAVLSIYEDSKGNLWVGTWGGGLNLFDYDRGKFKHFTKENSGLSSDNIFTIIEDNNGVLWVGAFWGGISYLDRQKNTFINYTPENSDLSDDHIRVITRDSSGHLWIGGDLGLNMFDPETETFIIYSHDENDVNSMSKGSVLSILRDNKSNLWIGTSGGLNKFDRVKQVFTHYQVKDGLPNDAIKGIREDDQGFLWLSTNKGLSKFNPETGIFKNYDVSDGLQDNEFYQCSHYKSLSGELFFGGVNGFNSFYPEDIIDNPFIPSVVITDFQIFNKPVPAGKDSPLQVNITDADKITLSYRYSVFSFVFASLNYISSTKNQYAYKLDGFDDDWNYVGNTHTATYTNIDPGTYTFRVKGSNNDGIWNEEGTSIQVIITPPFWRTWWFKSVIILFIFLLLIFIYYVNIIRVKRRNIILERLVQQRTREIDEKNKMLILHSDELNSTNRRLRERQQTVEEQAEELRIQRDQLDMVNSVKDKLFSIVAHDLKSPFNTLKGFIDLILQRYDDYSDEERKNMLNIVGESAENVFRLLDNLLNWSRSQRGIISFVPEMVDINEIIRGNINLFKGQAENKNIKVKFTSSAKSLILKLDKEMINIVIRNLLSNAIKFTRTNGKVELSSNEENYYVIITIKDDGVGISDEDKAKLFRNDIHFSSRGTNNETGTGLGLILCQELIEKHQGKIWIESELHKGATINISLPIDRPLQE